MQSSLKLRKTKMENFELWLNAFEAMNLKILSLND